MFGRLWTRIRKAATAAVRWIGAPLRTVTRPVAAVGLGLGLDLTRSRRELLVENALLRQQLIIARRHMKRPKLRPHERGFVVLLAALTRTWRDALLLVKPDTILRWHRSGYRLFWRCNPSREGQPCPQTALTELFCNSVHVASDSPSRRSSGTRSTTIIELFAF